MNSILIEISVIIILIILNGFLALSEMALVSARKTRLEQLAKENNSRAMIALKLANAPDGFLSTIQIGITFIGILAGAFGGATIAELLAQYYQTIPLLAPYDETISVAIVVVCITYLSVVVGELIPKRLALNNPEWISCLVAPAIYRLSKLAHPLVIMLSGSTNIILRIFGVKSYSEPSVTEEEIKLLIDKGTQAGTFQEFEQEAIERVFRLADRRVAVLMTPRTDIVWIDINENEEETKRLISQNKYSAYPVARDSLDDIVGVLREKELLTLMMEGKPFKLKEICLEPLYISEMIPAVKAIDLFKKSKVHIALVVDEYGAVKGLVTFGDILRSVFEDAEESFEGKRDIIEREDGSFLISGSTPLDEFMDFMDIGELDEEKQKGMNTVGGLIMAKLGEVPSEGQYFKWMNLKFEILDMDGRRVDKILVSRIRNDMESIE